MTAPDPTAPRRPTRLVAASRWLGVALALLGSVTPSLHLALTTHEMCEADGEVTHARHAHATPVADDASAALRASDHDEAGGHDHCGVLGILSHAVTPAASLTVILARPSHAEVAVAPAPPDVAGPPRLRLAPKQSPPLAA
ncbi:MAG: hypothetical protein U1F43_08620 [Myxococcota bacterium]